MLLYVLPYLCTFAAVFSICMCVRTLYIGKSLKRFYLPFAAVFLYDKIESTYFVV